MRASSGSLRPVIFIISVGAAGLWGLPLPVEAAMFQWTKPDGSIGITDDPGRIPEAYRSTAKPYQPSTGGGATMQRMSPGAPETGEAPPPEASSGEPVDQLGHNQAWWQKRVRTLREERASTQQKRDEAEELLNKIFYFGGETPREMSDQATLRKQIETLNQALARIDRQLTDELPDEARRAGAPPGWLRE